MCQKGSGTRQNWFFSQICSIHGWIESTLPLAFTDHFMKLHRSIRLTGIDTEQMHGIPYGTSIYWTETKIHVTNVKKLL